VLNVIDKLNEAFEDIFQPLSKEGLSQRYQKEFQRLIDETDGWVEAHKKEIDEVLKEIHKLKNDMKLAKSKASDILSNSPYLIANDTLNKCNLQYAGPWRGLSILRVVRGLRTLKKFVVDDQVKKLALRIAKVEDH